MTEPMADQLRRELACESLLECFHGLGDLDTQCFRVLVDAGDPLTVDEVAAAVDRERSTAYRSIQRLRTAGFVQQEQINYDDGGYYHVYSPTDPSAAAADMQRLLNDWYVKMGRLIQQFEDKYEGDDLTPPPEG
jgi:predicted transcriptional regulator